MIPSPEGGSGMGAGESSSEGRSVPLIWIDRDDKAVLFANQILAQHLNDEFLISFGQVSPPAILGSEEEQQEGLARVEFVPVKTIARIGLPAQRMREFVSVMQQSLDQYEGESRGA